MSIPSISTSSSPVNGATKGEERSSSRTFIDRIFGRNEEEETSSTVLTRVLHSPNALISLETSQDPAQIMHLWNSIPNMADFVTHLGGHHLACQSLQRNPIVKTMLFDSLSYLAAALHWNRAEFPAPAPEILRLLFGYSAKTQKFIFEDEREQAELDDIEKARKSREILEGFLIPESCDDALKKFKINRSDIANHPEQLPYLGIVIKCFSSSPALLNQLFTLESTKLLKTIFAILSAEFTVFDALNNSDLEPIITPILQSLQVEENFSFLKAVQEFENQPTHEKASIIINSYILEKSSKEINIDGSLRTECIKKYEEWKTLNQENKKALFTGLKTAITRIIRENKIDTQIQSAMHLLLTIAFTNIQQITRHSKLPAPNRPLLTDANQSSEKKRFWSTMFRRGSLQPLATSSLPSPRGPSSTNGATASSHVDGELKTPHFALSPRGPSSANGATAARSNESTFLTPQELLITKICKLCNEIQIPAISIQEGGILRTSSTQTDISNAIELLKEPTQSEKLNLLLKNPLNAASVIKKLCSQFTEDEKKDCAQEAKFMTVAQILQPENFKQQLICALLKMLVQAFNQQWSRGSDYTSMKIACRTILEVFNFTPIDPKTNPLGINIDTTNMDRLFPIARIAAMSCEKRVEILTSLCEFDIPKCAVSEKEGGIFRMEPSPEIADKALSLLAFNNNPPEFDKLINDINTRVITIKRVCQMFTDKEREAIRNVASQMQHVNISKPTAEQTLIIVLVKMLHAAYENQWRNSSTLASMLKVCSPMMAVFNEPQLLDGILLDKTHFRRLFNSVQPAAAPIPAAAGKMPIDAPVLSGKGPNDSVPTNGTTHHDPFGSL